MGRGSGIAVGCGVGCRCGSDPELLQLWHKLGVELAWERPYALGVAQKKKTKKQKKKKKRIVIEMAKLTRSILSY